VLLIEGNREPGANLGRSRHCKRGVHFQSHWRHLGRWKWSMIRKSGNLP